MIISFSLKPATPPCDGNPYFGTTQFCSSDWVVRLAPITYSVDTSNPSNPQLVRTEGGAVSNPARLPHAPFWPSK